MSVISPLAISARIANPLRAVSQRHWTVLAARGVLQTLVVSLLLLLGMSMLLGWAREVPAAVRLAAAAVTWAAVLWITFRSLKPALHRWSLSSTALQVDNMLPDSQERISSAVELSQTEERFRGSPQLLAHLIGQAEQDATRIDAAAVVPIKAIFRWFLALTPVLVLWAALAVYAPTARILLRGLYSALAPWQTPPAALVDVAVTPGDKTLNQGDSLQIVAKVAAYYKTPTQATLVRAFATGQSVSQNLEQTAGTEFALKMDNVQQGFRYKVATDRGDSPWYTVTVIPRPAISRLDVHYDFPKYTALDPRTMAASDGNIEAVVGSSITLTIHTADALVADKSQLIFDEDKPTRSIVPVTATADKTVYTARFDVSRSCDYRISLLNEYNLGNKETDLRSVTATPDLPPTISIISPKETITVRDDDEVLVMYEAGDDYGVAGVAALIQVDDHPERIIPLPIRGKDHRNLKEKWTLSVAEALRQENVTEASRISYQLKATDNRDPDPQSATSQRQTLLISKSEQRSFQDKLNEMRKEDIIAAIRKAIQRLNENLGHIASARDVGAHQTLSADQLRNTADLRDRLSIASKDLAATAGEYLDTPFAEVAKAAKDIAEGDMAHSADDVAKLALDNADRSAVQDDGDKAYKEAATARDALERLIQKVEEAQRKARAAELLKQSAKKQEEVAKAMEEHPEKAEENRQKQQEAINKLEEAMRNDPTLQDPKAQQLARTVAELENRIEQEQKRQTDLQADTAKQEEKQQAQEAANAIAEQQKKLNADVQKFAKADEKPLEQAHAQAPDQNQQDNLVHNIEQNQIQQAAQQAQQAADQLKQDAQKLKDRATNPQAEQQRQQQQDQQNQKAAENAQKNADDAAKDLQKEANKDTPKPADAKASLDKVAKAAEKIQQQADAVQQQNDQGAKDADVKKDAEAAKADAQQAAQDAQAAASAQDPKDAQQQADKAAAELAKAGEELHQAAEEKAKTDAAMADQQKQDAAQAADASKDLAEQQQQIADALKKEAAQQADAQNAPPPQQTSDQQRDLAQQTQQARDAAKQLAQQAKDQPNNAVAKRAEEAAKALDQAAAAQQAAAKADADNKPDDAAMAQADAQKELAKADDALRGHPEQAQASAQQPDAAQPDAAKPEQGQADQGQAKPEQSTAQAAQEAAQAQQQSRQDSNANAAADAAQALAQASHEAQQALPGQEQAEAGQDPAMDPGEEPGHVPGQTPDSKKGIAGTDTGGNNKLPPSVEALGINASEWAKLPPMMQKELMNASQHSGPPAYKEMIKNYYIRVSRLQNDLPAAERKQ